MTLQQLRYFVETANCGSIGKAAERLFIAQPSLSSALRELESEVGQKLFSRTSKGTFLTQDGDEFLWYARQVLEQVALLESRWVTKKPAKPRLVIMSQHYAFAEKALISMIKKYDFQEYDYSLQEGRIFHIIDDVRLMRSEIGILYMDRYNHTVVEKLLREGRLAFHPLFTAKPHVLISRDHPLAGRESLAPEDLLAYPRVAFERSDYNSLYFSDEMDLLKADTMVKNITVGDRGTMYHMMLALNAYTLTTGTLGIDIYGDKVKALPFRVKGGAASMDVGWIARKETHLSDQAEKYIEELRLISAEGGR